MGRRATLSPEEIYWAEWQWNLGYRWDDIGEALYCSGKTVQRACQRKFGPHLKGRKRPKLVYKRNVITKENNEDDIQQL